MIWNNEFLNPSPSVFDGLLQSDTTDLSDILFQEELLQELKTSNVNLTQYLIRPEIMTQLIDNITQLTEKDCFDKLVYSRVHAAYVSCEILTVGSSDISEALLANNDSLKKIISCLVRELNESELKRENEHEIEIKKEKDDSKSETNQGEQMRDQSTRTQPADKIKIVPQKATLISKLISNIHSQAPADLSCHITKHTQLFSDLIQVLVNNIDVSGSFEILSTFINRTNPPDSRYVFCEILSKLNFVFSLMNVMTLSNVEDKQRNACSLLCDIIVIGRQEATEQNDPSAQDMLYELIVSREFVSQMLKQMFSMHVSKDAPQIEVKQEAPTDSDVPTNQADHGDDKNHSNQDADQNHIDQGADKSHNDHSDNSDVNDSSTGSSAKPNKTAIICGMKVLQTLVEQKVNNSHANNNHVQNNINLVTKTVEQIQDEIAENLVNFHELLLNPPKQEPIKTTFGLIQKPLGYIRLEVVNLIRALLSTFSPVIIKKLVELKTMKVIIDLFIDYSWNNLLHTQVEQAVTYIIKNCRRDEDLKYQIDMQKHLTNHITEGSATVDSNDVDSPESVDVSGASPPNEKTSIALLSQLLNECDLIGRLLMPKESGEQANFGHIIQMINSIAISCDLDTIQDHLNEMKEKRPELYARWTTFVNVDVASFKEISLYYDVQSVANHTDNNYEYLQKRNQSLSSDLHGYYLNSSPNHHNNTHSLMSPMSNSNENNVKSMNGNGGDDQITAYFSYFSFTKESVIPSINVDVLPKARGSATNKSTNH